MLKKAKTTAFEYTPKSTNDKTTKRNSFRLGFGLKGSFRIIVNDKESSWGACEIIDVSVSGTKIKTPLDISADLPEIEFEIAFSIVNDYCFRGRIVWKDFLHGSYRYGIQWINAKESETQLLQQELNKVQLYRKKLADDIKRDKD